MDIEQDKLHPKKSQRPIASGKIGSKGAVALALFLAITALTSSYLFHLGTIWILSFYLCINLLYSFGLKNVLILDLVIIGIGFLLRIYAGGMTADIPISNWLSIMVFLISVFMGLAKRRDDILILENTNILVRKNIEEYSIKFIEQSMTMIGAVIVVAYIMYTLSPEIKKNISSEYLFITSVFVILGVMKYFHRILHTKEAGNPIDVFYNDRFIQLVLLAWLVTFYFLIYFKW